MNSARAAVVIGGVVVALVVAGVVLLGGDDTRAASSAGRTYRDVCAVLDSADAGRDDAASRQFADRVHGPIHTVAAETAAIDRTVAGRLLEAKNAVEDAIETQDELVAPLGELADVTRDAARVMDGEDPGRC